MKKGDKVFALYLPLEDLLNIVMLHESIDLSVGDLSYIESGIAKNFFTVLPNVF
ncbi:MAG: hypothetical protein ACTS73_02880 [Arsenophonus sp. NEOnobi-MAG3]